MKSESGIEIKGPESGHMEPKDLLLPLVGALWACSTFVLPLALELNRIRDKVIIGVDAGNTLTKAHKHLLLVNDWMPLNYALIGVCALFGFVCLGSPLLLSRSQRKSWVVRIPVLFVALVPLSTAILWLSGIGEDAAAMQAAIAATPAATNTPASTNATVTNAITVTNAGPANAPATSPAVTTAPSIPNGSSTNLSGLTNKTTPYNATTVAVSHSALCAVMAGFALAGLFLLIERANDKPTPRQHSNAMLLLFVAFLTGGLAAYLYSSITGDPPIRGYYLFLFPSAILALHVFSLFAGINIALAAFQVDANVRQVARKITHFVVAFTVYLEGYDLLTAAKFFRPASDMLNVGLATVVPLAVIFGVTWLILGKKSPQSLSAFTFARYCYAILAVSLLASIEEGRNTLTNEQNIRLHIFIPALLFILVVGLGIWTCHVIESETKVLPLSDAVAPTSAGT